jgi:hypothetical protein
MMVKSSEEADAMSDYTEAEGLRAEITRLIAVEKTLDEEFWALPEGSAAAASTARAAGPIGDQDSASGSQIVGGPVSPATTKP